MRKRSICRAFRTKARRNQRGNRLKIVSIDAEKFSSLGGEAQNQRGNRLKIVSIEPITSYATHIIRTVASETSVCPCAHYFSIQMGVGHLNFRIVRPSTNHAPPLYIIIISSIITSPSFVRHRTQHHTHHISAVR